MFEVNEAARLVQEAAHPEANIIFGTVIDSNLGDECRITVIAAGFDVPKSETQAASPAVATQEATPASDGPAQEAEESPAPAPATEAEPAPAAPPVPESLPEERTKNFDNNIEIPDFLK